MKCPKCNAENRDGARFCDECATPLVRRCPSCGNEVRPNAKFCDNCAHDLIQPGDAPPSILSFEEKLDKIQRYLPNGLTEKILAQRGKIEGERKQVTVMFCDMEGFGLLSEKLGHEKVYSIMDDVFEILIHKVHDYGGTVNKMTGDGIMALFGAPIALEDAPQRAIRSALSIQREMTRVSDRIKGESGIRPIKMRIGINTGPVVVGTLGNDLRVEFTAVGDTVNLASRMEELAEPGTTYVTEDTFKLTEGLFRFEVLGERQIKGKATPVKSYRVIAPSTSRTRFDVSAERGLTPFVGRERELELLLDGFERAKAGRGQAFSIIGEAGVGKSRLLYEFRKAIANEDMFFQVGRCFSYSKGIAYHPLIDLLKSTFDIREGDEEYHIRGKVQIGLRELAVDEDTTLPYFLELLSVKDSGIDNITMSLESIRDRTIEALKRISLKASEIRPLIMTIEDLHWVDKSTEDVSKALLESIAGGRVLLILTYRPEYLPPWGGKSYHNQVTLNRLSNRESMAMVASLLGTEYVEKDLEEMILEKTEGFPFFIEELIKSMKELGLIEIKDNVYSLNKDISQVTVPSTIQDVIMARIDSLPDATKSLLQTASVIEREFSYDMIRQVTGMAEQELLSHLSGLKDSELLYERGVYPQSTYVFKHYLTREVAYDSILTPRRKKLHVEIGNAIEAIYNDNLSEHYAVLSEHYILGENFEKGAEYCRLAGRKAEKAASLDNAIAHGEKRIACLEKLLPTEEVQRKIIDARTTLGLYHLQMTHYREAKEAVDPIVTLAMESDYKRRISQIYSILGVYHYGVEEDYTAAVRYLEDGLKIADELNDQVSLVTGAYWLGSTLSINCEFEKALYWLERGLEINSAANVGWGIAAFKSGKVMYLHYLQGQIDLAYHTSEEIAKIAEESGDKYSKAFASLVLGFSYLCKGFLEDAEEHFLRSIASAEDIRFDFCVVQALAQLAETYFDMGKYDRAQESCLRAISLMEQHGVYPSWAALLRIIEVTARIMNNELDADVQSLCSYTVENRMRIFNGWMARYLGLALMNIDETHLSEAEDWLKKAINADTINGMRWHLAKDYASYADLYKRKGDIPRAEEQLAKAIDIFKECGTDGWVTRYEERLKTL
ncbi:MAG: AAA family ATPase [Dehalococcoidia bacterium]|nr:MAG: AAA family ATPase [Dehalococcoidia bacterium]